MRRNLLSLGWLMNRNLLSLGWLMRRNYFCLEWLIRYNLLSLEWLIRRDDCLFIKAWGHRRSRWDSYVWAVSWFFAHCRMYTSMRSLAIFSPTLGLYLPEGRDSICKSFIEPRNLSPAWRAGTATHCICRIPAESIPRNRFLGSINVYKYGLWMHVGNHANPSVDRGHRRKNYKETFSKITNIELEVGENFMLCNKN